MKNDNLVFYLIKGYYIITFGDIDGESFVKIKTSCKRLFN